MNNSGIIILDIMLKIIPRTHLYSTISSQGVVCIDTYIDICIVLCYSVASYVSMAFPQLIRERDRSFRGDN